MEKQTCAVCGVVHIVPEKHQVNHCTVEVTHHYGSPKDGTTETFDVCLDCIKRLLIRKPIKTKVHF